MTDDYALEGEETGYVPCFELPAVLVVEEEGVISGLGTGRVARGRAAASLPVPERAAIVGSGVGFVPKPCCEVFIIGGASPAMISTSVDGSTWVAQTIAINDGSNAATQGVRALARSNTTGVVVAVGGLSGIPIASSADGGVTWIGHSGGELAGVINLEEVTWSPDLGLFLVSDVTAGSFGYRLWTSPDGATWTHQTIAATGIVGDAAWSPELGIFVIPATVGAVGGVFTSPDAITWTQQTISLNATAGYTSEWAPELGLFVVASVGGTSQKRTSPDGITWSAVPTPGASVLTESRIRWIPELGLFFHGTGSVDQICTSPDGLTWTVSTPTMGFAPQTFAWSRELELLFAGGPSVGTGPGRLSSSPDAIAWTPLVSNIDSGVGADQVRDILIVPC